MHLKNLRLINFKNYTDQTVSFPHSFTAVVGPNGSGKTNLLEAIHYLSLTKSLTGAADVTNIRFQENFFSLIGQFEDHDQTTEVRCTVEMREGTTKKEIRVAGKECKRFADHVGKFPVVSIIPHDIELIWESGEVRRKFFDQWMSQTDRSYLEDLIKYQQLLKQRNALLKAYRETGTIDHELLSFFTKEMIAPISNISAFRRVFIEKINPVVRKDYQQIIEPLEAESIEVQIDSDLSNSELIIKLNSNLEQDLKAGRTTMGPHLDEYHFLLNGGEVRKFGSQGQQKSFLVALKLAMYEVLRDRTGVKPILLLDDIFDKMDDVRIGNLLSMSTGRDFGQVILTDSSPVRAMDKLKEYSVGLMKVEKGQIISV